jgi:hypothetical protein
MYRSIEPWPGWPSINRVLSLIFSQGRKKIGGEEWGLAEWLIDRLPTKCETLNSNPSTAKKKKKNLVSSNCLCILAGKVPN